MNYSTTDCLSTLLFFLNITELRESDAPWKLVVFEFIKVYLIVLMGFVMFSTGCCVNTDDIRHCLGRPTAAFVCLLCQFILTPLVSFGFSQLINLEAADALGLVFVTTSPSGIFTNLYTYCVEGDLTLRFNYKFNKCYYLQDMLTYFVNLNVLGTL